MLKNGINAMAKALSEYHEEMQQNIDQATSDLRETLEQIEIQNVELDMAKRAQEAARVKSEFLANMSHELRTPLNGVIGFTRQLLKTSLTPSQTDYMQTIEKSARNLLGIINDILDFSKLEAGKLQLEHIPFSLRDTLNETMHLLGPSAHDKQLELAAGGCRGAGLPHRRPHAPAAGADQPHRQRHQVHRARQRGCAHRADRQCQRQQGAAQRADPRHRHRHLGRAASAVPGLQPGRLLHLPPLWRHRPRLVITQKLVQQMGGQIRFESELGKGSVFSFSLDLEVSPAPDRQAAAGSHPGQAGLAAGAGSFSHSALCALLAEWQLEVQSLASDAPGPK